MRPTASPLALALALAAPTVAQAQGTVGAPTGPFQVGTIRVTAVDSSRAELSAAGTSDARRLVVQVWYPAQPTGRERRAPYVLELDQVAADLAEAVPEVAFGKVRTSALVDATATRHPGIAFALASANFANRKEVLAAIGLFLIVNAVVSGGYLLWYKRSMRMRSAL